VGVALVCIHAVNCYRKTARRFRVRFSSFALAASALVLVEVFLQMAPQNDHAATNAGKAQFVTFTQISNMLWADTKKFASRSVIVSDKLIIGVLGAGANGLWH
jgi:hypothetical protein